MKSITISYEVSYNVDSNIIHRGMRDSKHIFDWDQEFLDGEFDSSSGQVACWIDSDGVFDFSTPMTQHPPREVIGAIEDMLRDGVANEAW